MKTEEYSQKVYFKNIFADSVFSTSIAKEINYFAY